MEFDPVTNCITKCNHHVKTCIGAFLQVGDVKQFHTYLDVKIFLWKWPYLHNIFYTKIYACDV